MPKFVGSVARYPARALCAWYFGLISVGTLLLMQPFSRAPGRELIPFVDALFTATSATCVTGLVVLSTPNDFSIWGQLVILLLMQLGGIGIMTATTFLVVTLRGRETLRYRATLMETLGAGTTEDLRRMLRQVLQAVFLFEGIAFVVLFVRFLLEGDKPVVQAAWYALFFTVSAFCNAGFALYDDSLTRYQHDVTVNVTIILLIVIGGIGFPVLRDIQRNWRQPGRARWQRLQLHTKLVLLGSLGLWAMGIAAFLSLEWNNTLAEMSGGEATLVSVFQSVTSRTAGFNTVDTSQLTNATLFIMMLLMFVGAAPGSTAGGVKVSTLMVLVLLASSRLRGAGQVKAFRRAIPGEVIGRAIVTVLVFLLIGTLALALILVLQEADVPHPEAGGAFLDAFFEIVSALCTVGLSTGYTDALSTMGKYLIIVLMFAGRIGPLSVVAILAREHRESRLRYAEEDVLIG